jgi:hypothetical protein
VSQSRRSTNPAETAQDLDEDLFDFASVVRGSDTLAPERDPLTAGEDLGEVLSSIRDTQAGEEAARAASTPAPRRQARPSAPAQVRGESASPSTSTLPRARIAPELRAAPCAPAPTLPARPRRSVSLALIAVAVTLLNSALALVVVRSQSPADAGPPRFALSERPLDRKDAERGPETLRTPARAHPALDEAWAEVARGEYAAARQRAYSLLALVDGLESPERGTIEADCRYLIAQALFLDALERREEAP